MELQERINVLIQGAEIAQKNGALTLDEAYYAKQAVDALKNNVSHKAAIDILIKIASIGILMTLIELIAGLIFIKGMHIKLWDYSDRWGNFKGVICPLFSFIWLVVGCLYYFLLNPYLVMAISWISENLIYTFFIGGVVGAMIVDTCYSLHVGIKIRQATGPLVVKYEQFKVDLKNEEFEISHKKPFYGTLVMMAKANNSLKEKIAKHVENLPIVKHWWKKDKKEK